MNAIHQISRQSHQHGMVLLLCLIFMTSMTLLSLTAATDTITQTQLAANLRDAERARHNGQLSLQWLEQWLFGKKGTAPENCSASCTGFFAHPADSLDYNLQSESLAWWTSQGYEVGLDPETGARLASIGTAGIDPTIWIIQSLHRSPASADGSTPQLDWYRILVRSTGRSANTVSVIESVVKVGWSGTSAAAIPANRVAWQELR